MKERPILFSAPMVRALLDGSKTQTRRAMRDQPSAGWSPFECTWLHGYDKSGELSPDVAMGWGAVNLDGDEGYKCPYGQPGDRLWVREAFDFLPAGGPDGPQACEIVYWATGSTEPRCAPESYNPMIYGREKVRPSIHMPRWASRITLEVTSVRVERLQEISEADAVAEGVTPKWEPGCSGRLMEAIGGYSFRPAASAYADLWESINGEGSWDANPWVWVIEFRRLA